MKKTRYSPNYCNRVYHKHTRKTIPTRQTIVIECIINIHERLSHLISLTLNCDSIGSIRKLYCLDKGIFKKSFKEILVTMQSQKHFTI